MRPKDKGTALDCALKYLQYRDHSRYEMEVYLHRKEFTSEEIAQALQRLQGCGYLNDARFSAAWMENRTRFSPRGRMGLRQELTHKGVDTAVVENALNTWGTDEELAAALVVATKALPRYRGQEPIERHRKLGALLGRRGFGYDVIRRCLERLDLSSEEVEGFDGE